MYTDASKGATECVQTGSHWTNGLFLYRKLISCIVSDSSNTLTESSSAVSTLHAVTDPVRNLPEVTIDALFGIYNHRFLLSRLTEEGEWRTYTTELSQFRLL